MFTFPCATKVKESTTEKMDSAAQNATVEISTHAPAKRKQPPAHDESGKLLARTARRFAEAMFETGDVSKAYLESHPDCKSTKSAKYRGSALLKRGEVRAYIASLKAKAASVQGVEANPRRAALLAELDSLGYATVNLKKLHPKEKLTALRTIAEIEGWMKPAAGAAGLRATFNFRIGGQAAPTGRGEPQTVVTMDMDTETGSDAPAPTTQAPGPQIEVDVTPDPAPPRPMFDAENS